MGDKITRINLEPDKPALDGRNLDRLVELWKEDLQRRAKPESYHNCASIMKIFQAWWSSNALAYNWLISDVTLTAFVRYLAGYQTRWGRQMTVNSQRYCVRVVKSLFRWAYSKGYVDSDFSVFVPKVKGEPEPKEVVKLADLNELLAQAAKGEHSLRDQAVIAVLAGTGLRCIECAALTIGDVSMTSDIYGIIHVRVAKGNRPRVVAFDRFTGGYLSAYLDTRAGSFPASPLFLTKDGGGCTARTVSSLIARLADSAGVAIRAHDLRRMFATHWARERPGEGYGQLLTKQMGHTTVNMTSQYMLQDTEDLVRVMRDEAISPMAALHNRENGSHE